MNDPLSAVIKLVADAVARGAGSGDNLKEVRARLLATGIFEKYSEWLIAETDRDTDLAALISVTTQFAVGVQLLTFSDPLIAHRQAEMAEVVSGVFRKDLISLSSKAQEVIARMSGSGDA